MNIGDFPVVRDKRYRTRLAIIAFATLFLLIGLIFPGSYDPARWMTYRDFDVPGERNFIMYLMPGIPDSSSHLQYDFTEPHWILALAVMLLFFPTMLLVRILFDYDFKLGCMRFITQWLMFVVARLGILRVSGICPVKRTALGVFPFMNCQSCELATGACPLGTFQMSLLNHQFPFLLVGQLLLVGIVSGRWVCGWLCPYGFLSDIFDKIPGKRIKVPAKVAWIKYGFLGLFLLSSMSLLLPGRHDFLAWCAFLCPTGFYFGVLEYVFTTGFHNFGKGMPYFHVMLIYHFIKAAAVIVLSAKIGGRFYCKYMCPIGTVLGLFNKSALFRIIINMNRCTNCKRCVEVCPMKIDVRNGSFLERSSCIECGRCKKACPTGKVQFSIPLGSSNLVASKSKSRR
jgi:ferredoxin-type protein NapH